MIVWDMLVDFVDRCRYEIGSWTGPVVGIVAVGALLAAITGFVALGRNPLPAVPDDIAAYAASLETTLAATSDTLTGEEPDAELPTGSTVSATVEGDLFVAVIHTERGMHCWETVLSVAGEWVRDGSDTVAVTSPRLVPLETCAATPLNAAP